MAAQRMARDLVQPRGIVFPRHRARNHPPHSRTRPRHPASIIPTIPPPTPPPAGSGTGSVTDGSAINTGTPLSVAYVVINPPLTNPIAPVVPSLSATYKF